MQKSAINQLAIYVKDAFLKLDIELSHKQVEDVALLIYNCMIGQRRIFHTPQHVIQVCKHLEHPLQILAVLFHDVVYYQADGGIPQPVEDLLAPYIALIDETVYIQHEFDHDELSVQMAMDVYQLRLGQQLSIYKGLNEFLSTLVAIKVLEKYLNPIQLLKVTVCIEATIPFRGRNEEGQSHYEYLEAHLQKVAVKHQLGLNKKQVIEIIKLAVMVANQDVENFSDTDTGRFLDNTWRLLPETNVALYKANVFTLSHYRSALQKTQLFLGGLNPDYVFQQYANVPEDAVYQRINYQAHRNLSVANEYLRVKIVSIAILEALAKITGGDIPVSMFTGDIRECDTSKDVERAEDYLPAVSISEDLNYDPTVLELLEFGRASPLNFDIRNAPISYYIYARVGSEKIQEYTQKAKEMFSENISSQEFLNKIDKDVISAIVKACSEISITRRDALMALLS